MIKFRILLVEDEPEARRQMKTLLTTLIPDCKVKDYGDVTSATLAIKELAGGPPFDVAILDFRLPKTFGGKEEIDESLCALVREVMPDALIVHITGYLGEEPVKNHVNRLHPPHKPRGLILGKPGNPPQDMSRIRSALYAQCIDRRLDELGRGLAPYVFRGRPELSSQSTTTLITDLCNDLSAYWPYLDDQMKERLLQYFDHEESEGKPPRFFPK